MRPNRQTAGGKTAVPPRRRVALRLAGWAVLCAAAVFLVYYWRVFYSFDRFSPLGLTALAVGLVSVLYAAFWAVLHFIPSAAGRAAALLAAAGLCFCFANPPMQTPDESEHFLRAYAISLGRFDFDAERGYPDDVDLLMACFPGAYTNGNDGKPIKQYYHLADADDPDSARLPDGEVRSVADCFAAYRSGLAALRQGQSPTAPVRTEPIVVMLLPYLPQALGITLARLAGFSALGCLYAGRLANLAVYVLLIWLALRGLRRWQGVFLAVAFLPLSLYMAASLSYDAQLLGLYALAAALLLRESFTSRHLWAFAGCILLMNAAKPWINLLWIFGLLFIEKKRWQARLRPWQAVLITLAAALAFSALLTWYGRTFRYNYGELGRMLGSTVAPLQQLQFVLRNPLRTLAVLWGTLNENVFFLPGLGTFGALDTPVPAVAYLSAALLVCGAFAEARRRPLCARLNIGLACFAAAYGAGVMMAMYITYTPVGMVRVIGLQARYFLPVLTAGLLLAAQGLGLLQRRAGLTAVHHPQAAPLAADALPALLPAGFLAAVLGALLLFEAYFIGPVSWVLSEFLL